MALSDPIPFGRTSLSTLRVGGVTYLARDAQVVTPPGVDHSEGSYRGVTSVGTPSFMKRTRWPKAFVSIPMT